MNIEEVRDNLSFLAHKEVVLFGSYVTGDAGPRSDIDVAIITRENNRKENFRIRIEALGSAPDGFDIQIFEVLPLIIKGSIIENFEVLFGNPLEIGMYFFKYRKFWEDFSHRIEIPTLEEIQKGLSEHKY
ncbi:MAG: nucleotidyltransferase domain-containing protein [Candidatus Thorarchaeota archaeon]